MAQFKPFKLLSTSLNSLPIAEGQLIFTTDTKQIFVDINASTRLEYKDDATFKKYVDDSIADLTGSGTGSVNDMIEDVTGAIANLNTNLGDTLVEAINTIDDKASDNAQNISDINDTIGTVTEGKTVVGMISDAQTASTVTVSAKETANTGYLKTYVVKQNNISVGEIDIPKDLVVTSGSIVEKNGAKYLRLTIANQTEPIDIAVADLVDVYTAQASAAQVQLIISNTNEISATIVAASISATELANNAVETAKIKDKNVTKAKLADSVQTSLNAADTAVQPAGLTAAIEALDATKTQTAGIDGLALSIIETDGKITAISGSIAANTYDTHGAAATAESNAKSYADGLASNYDAAGTAQTKANAAEANAKAYADSLVLEWGTV